MDHEPVPEFEGDDDSAAFDDWDEQDWAHVDVVQAQIDEINAIEKPSERKEAARLWAASIGGN